MRFLRRMSRIFVWLGAALLGLVSLLAVVAALIVLRPEWFIRASTLRWAAEHLLPAAGVQLSFTELKTEFAREDFFRRSLRLDIRDLHVIMRELDLTVPTLAVAAAFDLHPQRLAVTSFGPLTAIGTEIDFRQGPPDPAAKPLQIDAKWYERLRRVHYEPIAMEFDRINFTPYKQRPLSLKSQLRLQRSADDGPWSFGLDIQELRADLDNLKLDMPRASLALTFDLDPQNGLIVQQLGPATIEGKRLEIELPAPEAASPTATAPEPALAFLSPALIEQLKRLDVEAVHVAWKDVIVKQPAQPPMRAELDLRVERSAIRTFNIAIRATRVQGIPVRSAALEARIKLPEGRALLPVDANIKGRADLGTRGSAQLDGHFELDAGQAGSARFEAGYNFGPSRLQARATAQLKDEKFAINLNAELSHPHERLQKLALEQCQLSGSVGESRRPFLQSLFACRLALTRTPAPAEQPFQDMLPRLVQFDVRGPLTIPEWNKDPRFTAPLTIDLVPLESSFYRLSSRTKAELSGHVLGGAEGFSGTVDLDTKLELQRFQNFVKRFEATDFSVPAPFATLDGTIRCAVQGRISIKNGLVHMPLSCATELDSSRQTVWIKAEGLIETRKDQKPRIALDVDLQKITLELPKLSLDEPLPQMLPDKRIVQLKDAKIQAESEPLPLDLDVTIRTPKGRPLKLATHLAPQPIPISIDLTMSGDRPTTRGTVAITDYNVSFLKKKADIESIGLRFDSELGAPSLEGRLFFPDPNYRIELKLSGTVERPFYSLESRPPRTQSEIISIILFGDVPDELDVDTQRSVEDTRAAMVDGAIGLMSMYYLAATPIETVGYNPHTGIFRARVRLGQTLSLTVGSDLEGASQTIGVRKRLTENWSFETTAETDQETKAEHGVAMFRWGRRY